MGWMIEPDKDCVRVGPTSRINKKRCPFFHAQPPVGKAGELWSLATCERDAVHTRTFLHDRRTQSQSQRKFPLLLRTSVASPLAPHI